MKRYIMLLLSSMILLPILTCTPLQSTERPEPVVETVYYTNTVYITNYLPVHTYLPWSIIGARISSTYPGIRITAMSVPSAAHTAGLKRDDIITAINGKTFEETDAVIRYIRDKRPGTKIQVTLQRGTNILNIEVTTDAFETNQQLPLMAREAAEAQDYGRVQNLVSYYILEHGQNATSTALKSELSDISNLLPEHYRSWNLPGEAP